MKKQTDSETKTIKTEYDRIFGTRWPANQLERYEAECKGFALLCKQAMSKAKFPEKVVEHFPNWPTAEEVLEIIGIDQGFAISWWMGAWTEWETIYKKHSDRLFKLPI